MKIKSDEQISYLYYSLSVIFNDKRLRVFQTEYDMKQGKVLTFQDILNLAKSNGYMGGNIYLITESEKHGKIYLYNNYGDYEWWEHGITKGVG